MKYVPHDYQAYAAQFILVHPVAAIHPASCGHGLNLQAGGDKKPSHRRRGMNAYEYLSQAYMLEQRIRTKLQHISALRSLPRTVSSFTDNEPVSHTRNVTQLEWVTAITG